MRYQKIVPARFMDRPNRFVAHVMLDGRQETVHVKNTGRCRELLIPGARVYLEEAEGGNRKTKYDLVAVEKATGGAVRFSRKDNAESREGFRDPEAPGEWDGAAAPEQTGYSASAVRLINMDSQAPNRAVEEWLLQKQLFPGLISVRPETRYGNSRFDFYIETPEEKIFMEVKGVTLEEDGETRFPDAPSERAVKHVEELAEARRSGYRAVVLFVIQMEGVRYFTPNRNMHPEFAEALQKAVREGVEVLAYDCRVTPREMTIKSPVPVYLDVKDSERMAGLGENSDPLKTSFRFGDLSDIPKPLLKWYDTSRRILPWREEPTPYRVWVSEIMLQQTRVEAVKPYFERFMEALPDIPALAGAEEEKLLKLWEGLGYYNRVRNLQRAAVQIMEEYGGRMPDTCGELLKLKGIGSYTAGAIASIAYGRQEPAVDGNVLRVVSRLRMDDSLITDAKVKAGVERDLSQVIPADRPGDFNQAMMEIGACVCVPNGPPRCGECPLGHICAAHRQGCETDYPRKAGKKPRKIEEKTILVIRDGRKAALRKRPGKGLLAGMYELPSLEGVRTAGEVAAWLGQNGLRTLQITPLGEAKHIFTHLEWRMHGYLVRVDELADKNFTAGLSDWLFIEPEEAQEKYPLPSAFAYYVKYLNIKQGNGKY